MNPNRRNVLKTIAAGIAGLLGLPFAGWKATGNTTSSVAYDYKSYVKVLDISFVDGRVVFLDGHGGESPGSAKWRRIGIEDVGKATNSRGELFRPNVTIDDFKEPFRGLG